MFGFGKKKEMKFRKARLPGDIVSVSFPDLLFDKLENDETLMAYIPNDNTLYLRFSSLTIVPKDPENSTKGYDTIRETALEKGLKYEIYEDKYILTYDEQNVRGDASHVMRYWQIGCGNIVIYVSASLKPVQSISRLARAVLDVMPQVIESLTVNHSTEMTETSGKQIPITTEPIVSEPQQAVPFGTAEKHWLQANLDKVAMLAIKYASSGELTPAELDIIFSRWLSNEPPKESNEDVANALGAAFGQYFVDKLGFEWVVHAIIGQGEPTVKHGALMTYPLSVVWKRIDSGDTNFFENIYTIISKRLNEINGT